MPSKSHHVASSGHGPARCGEKTAKVMPGCKTAATAAALAILISIAAACLGSSAQAAPCCGPNASTAVGGGDENAHPAATAAVVEQTGEHARLIFEVSTAFQPAAFVLADPLRAVVDLPQTDFALPPETGKPETLRHRKSGLITAFRFGEIVPGRSRIVIDLAAPAKILRAACEKTETDGRMRLIIELAKTDVASFESAAVSARAQAAATPEGPPPPSANVEPARPRVVIDPGHGGIDRGATVKGLVEKDLTLAFAKALAEKLNQDGRVAIVMTRQDDSFVSLADRVRLAREAKAALFISIHADTLSDAADVSGATIYTLSDRASDAEAARIAEKENQADAAAGLVSPEETSEISDILFDLTRRETRAFSQLAARSLADYWPIAGRLNKNPRRSARFRVLKAPDVPSILLELGYLSNDKDSKALASQEWREGAASQVAQAVLSFFSATQGKETLTKAASQTAPAKTAPEP